jgi:hypothetical protein
MAAIAAVITSRSCVFARRRRDAQRSPHASEPSLSRQETALKIQVRIPSAEYKSTTDRPLTFSRDLAFSTVGPFTLRSGIAVASETAWVAQQSTPAHVVAQPLRTFQPNVSS